MAHANDIRLIVSDVDGRLDRRPDPSTSAEQREIKEFNVLDGLAVKLAQKAGVEIALVTVATLPPPWKRRARELGYRGTAARQPRTSSKKCKRVAQKLSITFESDPLRGRRPSRPRADVGSRDLSGPFRCRT